LIRHPLIIAPIGAQRQALLTERLRHARDWVANRVKHVDSRISEVRLGSPAAFWTALLGIVLFAIVVAIVRQ
jgi:hypothetical protein